METETINIITEQEHGNISTGASHLDIPFRCRKTIEKNRLDLEFTYYSKNETLKKKKYGKDIRVYRGKNSGRIHKIQFLKLGLLENIEWREFIVDSILSCISSYTYGRNWHEYIIKQIVQEIFKKKEHHPFCNLYGTPVENCVSCKRLRQSYPENGRSAEKLVQDYFPEAILK